jgi:hypothetical protein
LQIVVKDEDEIAATNRKTGRERELVTRIA